MREAFAQCPLEVRSRFGHMAASQLACAMTPPRSTPQDKFQRQLSEYVSRMPTPPLTGNRPLDERYRSSLSLLGQVISGCLQDPDAILPVFKAWETYDKLRNEQYHAATTPHDQFAGLTSVFRCDDVFLIEQLASASDLSQDDLKRALTHTSAMDE